MAEQIKTLQQKMTDKATAKTDWDTPKTDWVYVTIPEENALGEKHASISNNGHTFEAGQTYLVPPKVAVDVKDRLSVYGRACVRVLQPKRDFKAEDAVRVGTGGGTMGATSVDPAILQ